MGTEGHCVLLGREISSATADTSRPLQVSLFCCCCCFFIVFLFVFLFLLFFVFLFVFFFVFFGGGGGGGFGRGLNVLEGDFGRSISLKVAVPDTVSVERFLCKSLRVNAYRIQFSSVCSGRSSERKTLRGPLCAWLLMISVLASGSSKVFFWGAMEVVKV
jgi:hypothetical protein